MSAIVQAIIESSNTFTQLVIQTIEIAYIILTLTVTFIPIVLIKKQCAFSRLKICSARTCVAYQEFILPEDRIKALNLGVDRRKVDGVKGKLAWCARGKFVLNPKELDYTPKKILKH